MATPLTPQQARAQNPQTIHPQMIEAVNYFLTEYSGKPVTILQKNIIAKFLELRRDYTEDRIFKEKLLDFESAFEKCGWIVTYEKPGYCEEGESSFTFKEKNI